MDPRCDLCNKLFDFEEQAFCAIKDTTNEILFVKCLGCAASDPNRSKKTPGIKWSCYRVGTELILNTKKYEQ